MRNQVYSREDQLVGVGPLSAPAQLPAGCSSFAGLSLTANAIYQSVHRNLVTHLF